MKLVAISLIVLVTLSSCRRKEVFPDLAKQIEGSYNIFQASFVYANPHRQLFGYNPKDSAQIGQIIINKIDPLSARIRMLVKKQSGEVIYDCSFDCELSRDLNNKGFINFNALGNNAGAYQPDQKIVSVGTSGSIPGKYIGVSASFLAKR
jgi:hypothetical protein